MPFLFTRVSPQHRLILWLLPSIMLIIEPVLITGLILYANPSWPLSWIVGVFSAALLFGALTAGMLYHVLRRPTQSPFQTVQLDADGSLILKGSGHQQHRLFTAAFAFIQDRQVFFSSASVPTPTPTGPRDPSWIKVQQALFFDRLGELEHQAYFQLDSKTEASLIDFVRQHNIPSNVSKDSHKNTLIS